MEGEVEENEQVEGGEEELSECMPSAVAGAPDAEVSGVLINIHAPNIDTHRKNFFIGLRKWIVTNCIIIGDFNITLTKSDISNNCTFSEDYSRNALFDIIAQNSLIDIWRLFHPGKKQFTRKQVILGKLKQSRLDLCLISSSLVPEVSSCLIRDNHW
uniref:Endonuclease/exonuclease/phosphatase domain-containing protein n=1 Tax=Xiphophorus couchianus TaxID=32473 RepID=A0A3B5M3J5_9TELE